MACQAGNMHPDWCGQLLPLSRVLYMYSTLNSVCDAWVCNFADCNKDLPVVRACHAICIDLSSNRLNLRPRSPAMEGGLQEPLTEGAEGWIKQASIEVRRGFVKKVYGILTAQLVLTTLVAYPIAQMPGLELEHSWAPSVSVATLIATCVIMICFRDLLRKFPTNYIVLGLFTAATGTTVGMACRQYEPLVIFLALTVTAATFALMTAYAFTTKSDMTDKGPYLFVGLCVLIMMSFGLLVLNAMGIQLPLLQQLCAVGGALLFAFYMVFDTQCMLGSWGGHKIEFSVDDYAFAALNLYLDIINFFLEIVQVIGRRD
ncbi:unnamed protein product [Effrenium voratum]|uniref:Uncharacterized protein n=1 Tax=Effrenium voratum TaxID=2562239 RepID=A0AA36I4K1_9DINO|nr:unnamed protein product [Effrenium voratum]CAJ1380617.1 unnamed protein product [Effrenium voratum]CAJ1425987.1 unnamed protein product [Effrenium voratum]